MKRQLRHLFCFSFALIIATSLTYTTLSTEIDQTTELPVLLYHHLLENNLNNNFNNNSAVNSYEDFEAQMKYLYDNGYSTVTSAQLYNYLYNNTLLPPKSVMITFDDGYLSNLYYAYPILKKYNYTAVVFLITNNIKDTPEAFDPNRIQFLSWSDIDGSKDVFEYGCHTHDMHYYLAGGSLLLTSQREEVTADIDKSLALNKTTMFAYPYGLYSNSVISVLKSRGFDMAFSNIKGYVKQSSNKFTLKRLSVQQKTTFEEFKNYIDKRS